MLTLRSVLPDRNPAMRDCAAVFQALDAVANHIQAEAMSQPILSEKRRILFGIWHDVMEVKNQVDWKVAELIEEQCIEMQEDSE